MVAADKNRLTGPEVRRRGGVFITRYCQDAINSNNVFLLQPGLYTLFKNKAISHLLPRSHAFLSMIWLGIFVIVVPFFGGGGRGLGGMAFIQAEIL